MKLTPSVLGMLNRLEARLQAKGFSNENLKIAFGETTNYFKELNKLPADQKAAKLRAVRQAAEDEFAGFFADKRSKLQEDISIQLDRLNRDFKFADEDTLSALKTRIEGLDRDTVEAIGNSFRNVINRGLGNSGALKFMADKIIQQREIAAAQVKDIADRSMRDIRTKTTDRTQDLNRGLERGLLDINTSQSLTTDLEEERLLTRDFNLFQETGTLAGVDELAPRATEDPILQAANSDPVISARLDSIKNSQPVSEGAAIQNRRQERRNNRLSRLNLSI